jgi:hypothetical protein
MLLLVVGTILLLGSGLISGHRADLFFIRLGCRLPRDLCAWLGFVSGAVMALQLPWSVALG